MKIWAKVTFKDGSRVQRLTLKVEGKGEEAELELALGNESQEVFAEEPIQQTLPEEPTIPVLEVPAKQEVKEQPAAEVSEAQQVSQEDIRENSVSTEEPEAEIQNVPAIDIPEEPKKEIQNALATEIHEEPEKEIQNVPAIVGDAEPEAIEEEVQVEEEQEAGVAEEVASSSNILEPAEAENNAGNEKILEPEAEDDDLEVIPELAKLAQESTSFNNFVDNVIQWVNVERNHRDYFKAVINAATKVGKVSWNAIEAILKYEGIRVNPYSKLRISKAVVAKFQNSKMRVTILKCIKYIVSYKNSFPAENHPANVNNSKDGACATGPKTYEKNTPKKVKMGCMPEIKEFEEALERIDKTQPVEERVKAVLAAMGMEDTSSSDNQLILGIANVAVNLKNIDFEGIFNNLDIPEELRTSARMRFSSFVNNFVEQHSPDANMVKGMSFLHDLQHVVLSEQEIRALV